MHGSVLHCQNTNDKAVLKIKKIYGNKQVFNKRQINGVEKGKYLHTKLRYPPVKDFSWIVKIHKIVDYLVTVQDIDISHAIWGNNIAVLKG